MINTNRLRQKIKGVIQSSTMHWHSLQETKRCKHGLLRRKVRPNQRQNNDGGKSILQSTHLHEWNLKLPLPLTHKCAYLVSNISN